MSVNLTLSIKDKQSLYKAYMPYLKGGGLFIPTTSSYQLNDTIHLSLQLPGDIETLEAHPTIVWITPKDPQCDKPAGIGVQFGEPDQIIRGKIETILVDLLGSDEPTHTL